MAAQSVRVPFQYFTNQDGTALDNGSIYIGIANQNPETNPISTYWNAALTLSVSQPITTNAGLPTYQGTPANIYIDDYAYSITVKDSGGRVVYTNLFVSNENFSSVTLAELPDVPPSVDGVVFLTNEGREGQFICKAGSAPSDPLEGIYVSSNTPGFYWERIWDQVNGQPEWFGAIVNNIAIDNIAAIQACINLCPVTQLQAAKYYIGTAALSAGSVCLTMSDSNKVLRGVAPSQLWGYSRGASQALLATRLIINSPLASGVLLGKATNPGSDLKLYTESSRIEDLTVERNVVTYPLQNPATGFVNAPKGIIMQFAAVCEINRVYSLEHSMGVYIGGTVACHLNLVRVLRYKAGTAPGNDFSHAYFQDNSVTTEFNSGNASLYYTDCGAFSNDRAGGGAPNYTENTGIKAPFGFTDTFITRLETSNVGYGLRLTGSGGTALNVQTEDLQITDAVLDGCGFAGILLENCGPNSDVTISGGYINVSVGTGPTAKAIWFNDFHGSATVYGIKLFGVAGNPSQGIYGLNSSGITAQGCNITNFQDPELWEGCTWFSTSNRINGATQTVLTAAVQLINCQSATIDPNSANSNGALPAMPYGVLLTGALNDRITIGASGIYKPSTTVKVRANGVDLTTTGSFNAGVSANNLLAGILV